MFREAQKAGTAHPAVLFSCTGKENFPALRRKAVLHGAGQSPLRHCQTKITGRMLADTLKYAYLCNRN